MADRPSIEHLMEAASEVLTDAWDAEVTLYLQDPIRSEWGRHSLLLCHVDGLPEAPAMVVVKAEVEANGVIFNEWAALKWLNTIEGVASLVPDLYGGTEDPGLIVIEDLGGGPTLHRVLQTRQQWALGGLIEAQQLLGAVQSATRGRVDELRRVRAGLPYGAAPPIVATAAEDLRAEFEAWGSIPAPAIDEIAAVANALDVPESFEALTFVDQCSVNRIVTVTGMRAVDLEMAAFRHPMIDGAFASLGHMSCMSRRLRANDGMVIPRAFRPRVTAAYRTSILDAFPEYGDDDRFLDDLTAAATVWLSEILRRVRPTVQGNKADGYFGVTARQRVLEVLTAFSELASSFDRLPALASWATDLSTQLRGEWPALPPLQPASALQPGET